MWSTLKKLIWLKINTAAARVWSTVTGVSPLTLANALAHAIHSLTQFGKCVQDGTPTPSAPVDIVCNNGALRVNRLDLSAVEDGHYWSATGVYTANASSRLSNTIPVKRGDVIAVTTETVRTGSSLNIRYNQFNASGEWVSQSVYTQSSNAPHTELITIGQDGFFNFSGNYEASVSMYVDWSKVLIINTTDPVFADGTPETLTVSATGAETQTVTDIPMLLSVGDITDEKDIISSGVTHRIGYHVFDGTETFSKSSAYGKAFLLNAAYAAWGADKTKAVLCTHFLGLPQKSSAQDDNTCFFNSTGHFYFRVTDNSDTDAFKAWLAAQYAAGTPVIVFFVLAEETTEQTTPHSLNSYEGATVVEAQTNVNPVTLSVEYAATS